MKTKLVLKHDGKPVCEVEIDLDILVNMTLAGVVKFITSVPIELEFAEGTNRDEFINACKFSTVILQMALNEKK